VEIPNVDPPFGIVDTVLVGEKHPATAL